MSAPNDAPMKPLVYCTRSIIAWQQGAKTQTRRLVKPPPRGERWRLWQYDQTSLWQWRYARFGTHGWRIYPDGFSPMRQPYAVGDLLWIREALERYSDSIGSTRAVIYQADRKLAPAKGALRAWIWKRNKLAAMFMPRWACRYYARVVSRRPEWLQDISDEDVIAEGTLVGIKFSPPGYEGTFCHLYGAWWNELHRKPEHKWNINPWVWVYELEPIDERG